MNTWIPTPQQRATANELAKATRLPVPEKNCQCGHPEEWHRMDPFTGFTDIGRRDHCHEWGCRCVRFRAVAS